METDFGLTEYIGERERSIPGVLKMLYSDFVVNEVDSEKKVIKLEDHSQLREVAVEERDAPEDETIIYPNHIDEETRLLLTQVYKREQRFANITTEGLSKDERKAVHEFIRCRFRTKLISETKENLIRVSRNVNNPFKKARWQTDKHPDHLHFTLGKENKETSYAIGIVAKFLNVKPEQFKTCGIKDRRAVTTQRVSVFRVEKEKMMALNARLRGISVYDCEYKSEPLKTGQHWGNRFGIVLRDLPLDSKDILDSRMKELKDLGFINYFGTQRFGSCGTSTAEVGRLILSRKWEEAIRAILNNPNDRGTVGDAVREFQATGNAQAARQKLKGGQAYASIESNILMTLAKGRSWQQAVLYLPTNIRSLYVHAYQSLLWNRVASRRFREHGLKLAPGDIGSSGEVLPEDASVYEVHIPLPGEIKDMTHYAIDWFHEMLKVDGLKMSAFASLEDRFSLGESYRAVFIRPEDVDWEFIQYEDPRCYLQDGLSDKAIPVEQRNGGRLSIRVGFNLPSGAYATVALREITGHDMGKQSMKDLCGIVDEPYDAKSTDENPSIKKEETSETENISEEKPSVKDEIMEGIADAENICDTAEDITPSDMNMTEEKPSIKCEMKEETLAANESEENSDEPQPKRSRVELEVPTQ